MRITAIRERTIRLTSATRNSSISFGGMTASVIAVHTDRRRQGRPLVGLAVDSIGRYGHGGLLRERFIPRLLNATPDAYADGEGAIDPVRCWHLMMADEKPGGHGERSGAVGLLDAALWDLAAKTRDLPLWALLAGRSGTEPDAAPAAKDVAVYASGGHYHPVDDVAALCADIGRGIDGGHIRFKIKIGGVTRSEDLARIEAVLSVLEPGMTLAVDGNGTFSRTEALDWLEALEDYPLAWLEEPVAPLDFDLHQDVAAVASMPLATGENLFSCDDARNLLRYGGLRPDRDVLQFDVSLSYGVIEYQRILDVMAAYGWGRARCAPHAGHLLAMHVVAGLGLGMAEVAMDTGTLFGRLTNPATVSNGRARLPEQPGVGLEYTPDFTALFDDLLS